MLEMLLNIASQMDTARSLILSSDGMKLSDWLELEISAKTTMATPFLQRFATFLQPPPPQTFIQNPFKPLYFPLNPNS